MLRHHLMCTNRSALVQGRRAVGTTQNKSGPHFYMSKAAPAVSVGRRQRSTHLPRMHITLAQLKNNWAAVGHAEQLGLRPSVHLDINFSVGGLFDPDQRASGSLRAFLKLARQWIERRGGQTAYIYALENRYSGIGETGVHAHVLIHVPDNLREDFHRRKRVWARNPEVGMVWRPGLFGPKGKPRKPIPTLRGVTGKLKYMSKDLDPAAFAIMVDGVLLFEAGGRVHLDNRGKPSNAPIYGLKTGVSRNINVTARRSYRQQRPQFFEAFAHAREAAGPEFPDTVKANEEELAWQEAHQAPTT